MSPYGAEEKQALLEAETLKQPRAEMLVALAEMELAAAPAAVARPCSDNRDD